MSDRIFVATRKGLFTVHRRGPGRYEFGPPQFTGMPVGMVMRDPRDGGILVAIVLGHFGVKFHRSDDDGATFVEVGTPEYPPRPEGAPDEKDMFGRHIPSKLHDVWAFAVGGPDQPKRLWCGTIPGALFRSDDGGTSWQLMESLWNDERRKAWLGGGADAPGIHSICVDPRDSRRVLIGVSSGGIWETRDDGATWAPYGHGLRSDYAPPGQEYDMAMQDPHRVVQCRDVPDAFWIQHHNGIFKSVDDAKTWQEIKEAGPSVFGFAVAVHPQDPNTAWFVPGQKDEFRMPRDGRFVVTRTRDGGKSFDVLSRGLPEGLAYDLVWRHAMEVDASGTRLVMGSTTGSLWVSDDSGDSWTHLSAHLPPIRCVHWA